MATVALGPPVAEWRNDPELDRHGVTVSDEKESVMRVVFDRVAGQARVRLAAASWSPSFAVLEAAGVNAG